MLETMNFEVVCTTYRNQTVVQIIEAESLEAAEAISRAMVDVRLDGTDEIADIKSVTQTEAEPRIDSWSIGDFWDRVEDGLYVRGHAVFQTLSDGRRITGFALVQ